MPSNPSDPTSLAEAARRLGGDLVGTVHDRVELLALELQEEKLRLTQMFIWASFVIFASFMAMTFGTLTLVYIFWEAGRLAMLIALTLLYGGTALALGVAFRRFLFRLPSPLNATLAELKKDAACIPTPS